MDALDERMVASTADVHRILEQLPEGADLMETPDGRERPRPPHARGLRE